jgi:RimJ/RimL family protein N-acetyltransferase
VEIFAGDLLLRPPLSGDLPAVTDAFADPEIVRFIPGVPVPYELCHAAQWLEKVDQQWDHGNERTFAIVETQPPRLLGMISIRLYEGGSLGYWLAPSVRGRGFMTQAVEALVRWAMTEQGIRRLTLTTHVENTASQRVALRAGFVRIGEEDGYEPLYRDGTTRRAVFEIRSVERAI